MGKALIFLTATLATSCGLVSKYPSGQHSVYATMLTESERTQINQWGEIRKDVELLEASEKRLLKGTLRIIKTDDPKVFNFVEVGQWIDHGRLGNSGKYHNLEFRDTTVNDDLGNSMSRVVYYMHKPNEYTLGERWTSRIEANSFIRHIEIYKDKVLTSEYDVKVLDFNTPKSDRQKKTVYVGTHKNYSTTGQLVSIRTYDDAGKLVKKE